MPASESMLIRGLVGQDSVRAFLASACDQGRVSHAYLFVGPSGSGKLDAAYALAQAIVCPDGGCGVCDACMRVEHHAHPDVHLLEPESAQGYLVGQIRDLIEDLALAPIHATRKVYILDGAQGLGSSSANALLKSLEEPPEGVTFILIGTSRDAILPTILSRCQVVPFRGVPVEDAVAALHAELGEPENLCRRAMGCCTSPAQARGFLESASRQEARRLALRALEGLFRADALDIMTSARAAVEAAKVTYAEAKEEQERARDEAATWMGAGALRQLEERQKRELAALERAGIMELFCAQRSLLRDALILAGGGSGDPSEDPVGAAGAIPACDDFAPTALVYARRLGLDGLTRAIRAVDAACANVRANVSAQLALEVMLFDIKEMLSCQS